MGTQITTRHIQHSLPGSHALNALHLFLSRIRSSVVFNLAEELGGSIQAVPCLYPFVDDKHKDKRYSRIKQEKE